MLVTKSGSKTNSGRIKNIDWEAMRDSGRKDAAEKYDIASL